MDTRSSVFASVLAAGAFLCASATRADFDAAGNYQIRCATCHGTQGEGTDRKGQTLGPALRGNPLVMHGPVPALAHVIRKGRSGAARIYDKGYPNMPAFGPETVPDLEALVAYLKGPLQSATEQTSAQPPPGQAQRSRR